MFINFLLRGGRRRLALLILVLEVNHSIWILEQPLGSADILPLHNRLNWLWNEILWVSSLQLYMLMW